MTVQTPPRPIVLLHYLHFCSPAVQTTAKPHAWRCEDARCTEPTDHRCPGHRPPVLGPQTPHHRHRASGPGFSTGEFSVLVGPRTSLYFKRGLHAPRNTLLDRFRTVIVVAALNVVTMTTGSRAWREASTEHVHARSGGAGVGDGTGRYTAGRGVIWAPAPSFCRTRRIAL